MYAIKNTYESRQQNTQLYAGIYGRLSVTLGAYIGGSNGGSNFNIQIFRLAAGLYYRGGANGSYHLPDSRTVR